MGQTRFLARDDITKELILPFIPIESYRAHDSGIDPRKHMFHMPGFARGRDVENDFPPGLIILCRIDEIADIYPDRHRRIRKIHPEPIRRRIEVSERMVEFTNDLNLFAQAHILDVHSLSRDNGAIYELTE